MSTNEDIYKVLVEEASVLAALYSGPEIRIRIANRLMLNAWNKDSSVIGKTIREANPEWEGQPFFEYLDNVYRTGEEYVAVEEKAVLPLPEGGFGTFFYNFSYKPLKHADGSIWGIVHTALDVTEQVQAKMALKESQDNYRRMLLHAPVAMCIYRGPQLILEIANERMLEFIGPAKEVLGKSLEVGVPEIKPWGHAALLKKVLATGEMFEAKERRLSLLRNNSIEDAFVNFTYSAIREGRGAVSGVLVTAVEVTDQVTARRKIQESEQRLQLAVENAEAGIYDTNLLTGKSVRSLRHAQIFGYPDNKEEWSLDKFLEHILPEDREQINSDLRQAFQLGSLDMEVRIKRLDGQIRWVKVVGKVHFDEQGTPLRLLGTTTDITGKKELQRQKDEFVSTVSHELKTPVTSIKAYGQILKRELSQPENKRNLEFLDKMGCQISRLEMLIRDLLEVTRIESGKLQLQHQCFKMNELISELVADLQLIHPSHRLIFSEDTELYFEGDKMRITQVLTNLINNAVKYSPGADRVHISLSGAHNKLLCSVQDLGIGVPDDQKEYIFDRFHQVGQLNREAGLSLGLGLYISKQIIVQSGGELWFESKEGQGSTFYFSLPLAEACSDPQNAA